MEYIDAFIDTLLVVFRNFRNRVNADIQSLMLNDMLVCFIYAVSNLNLKASI